MYICYTRICSDKFSGRIGRVIEDCANKNETKFEELVKREIFVSLTLLHDRNRLKTFIPAAIIIVVQSTSNLVCVRTTNLRKSIYCINLEINRDTRN